MTVTVLDMTQTARPPRTRTTTADMEAAARAILTSRGVNPDGVADQGQIAADIGVRRRTISDFRLQYRGPAGTRGRGRAGPFSSSGVDAIEPFPDPDRYIGNSPVWEPRWRGLAWSLTRERARAHLTRTERALLDPDDDGEPRATA